MFRNDDQSSSLPPSTNPAVPTQEELRAQEELLEYYAAEKKKAGAGRKKMSGTKDKGARENAAIKRKRAKSKATGDGNLSPPLSSNPPSTAPTQAGLRAQEELLEYYDAEKKKLGKHAKARGYNTDPPLVHATVVQATVLVDEESPSVALPKTMPPIRGGTHPPVPLAIPTGAPVTAAPLAIPTGAHVVTEATTVPATHTTHTTRNLSNNVFNVNVNSVGNRRRGCGDFSGCLCCIIFVILFGGGATRITVDSDAQAPDFDSPVPAPSPVPIVTDIPTTSIPTATYFPSDQPFSLFVSPVDIEDAPTSFAAMEP